MLTFSKISMIALVFMILNGCTMQSDSGDTNVQAHGTLSAGTAIR